MTLTALALLAHLEPKYRAVDYYGLIPGLERSFSNVTEGSEIATKEIVKPVEKIGQQEVFPIEYIIRSGAPEPMYVSVGEDGIYLYADADKKLVLPYRAILKDFNDEAKWSWRYDAAGEPVNMSCVAKPGSKQTIFGKSVDTIKLEVTGRQGEGDFAIDLKQSAIYGYKVGLIELSETTKTKKTKTVRTVKLVKIVGDGW